MIIGDTIDLSSTRRIHVVGIGGPGMSAIAQVLLEMGHAVSGSDIVRSAATDRLTRMGVVVSIGHDAALVAGCDAVTFSSAIPRSNIEVAAALEEPTIALLTRAQMLAAICDQRPTVAVAGTHGKTTTTSLLTHVLERAGRKPSFVIGGDVRSLETGAGWQDGDLFIVEADESDGTHLALPIHATILTNIDVDHLDRYTSFENIVSSFEEYVMKIDGPKVLCSDDIAVANLAQKYAATTYGIVSEADFRASQISFAHGASSFMVQHRIDGAYVSLGKVSVPLRGQHNVLNALAAIAMAMQCGVTFDECSRALSSFGGVARRYEKRGEDGGVTFIDDYAHLPTEIAAVLKASRDETDNWKRVVAVFQPNRFNRMNVLSPQYANAFVGADLVVVTEIYASGTTPIEGVTGHLVVDAVQQAHPTATVVWQPMRKGLIDFLANELTAGDLCISMGCGDIESLPDEVIERRTAQRGEL
jgi:UDP-N-acetylmuramate--alanine ligase